MKRKLQKVRKLGRYWQGSVLGKLGFCTSWAVDVCGGGDEWLEVVEVDLHIRNLGSKFRGKRIVQISDLHCSRTVSVKYLGYCVDKVNALESDVVVLTGDYITYDYRGHFRRKVADLVGNVESKYGVYACLGNHDYGVGGATRDACHDTARRLTGELEEEGVMVLRNESVVLEVGGDELRLVGLGDIWVNDLEAEQAFDGIGGDEVVVALVHNPEAIGHLKEFAVGAVMCGHTHGVEIEWRRVKGRPLARRRSYYAGMYKIGKTQAYVNRGLGRLGKAVFNKRPEITVFCLK